MLSTTSFPVIHFFLRNILNNTKFYVSWCFDNSVKTLNDRRMRKKRLVWVWSAFSYRCAPIISWTIGDWREFNWLVMILLNVHTARLVIRAHKKIHHKNSIYDPNFFHYFFYIQSEVHHTVKSSNWNRKKEEEEKRALQTNDSWFI